MLFQDEIDVGREEGCPESSGSRIQKACGDGGPVVVVLLTLLVNGTTRVGRVVVVGWVAHLAVVLVDHATGGGTVLARDLAVGSLVADGRELRTNTAGVGGRLALGRVGGTRGLDLVGLRGLGGSTLTFLGSLALSLFLLLASLPFLADLLEFCERRKESARSSQSQRGDSWGKGVAPDASGAGKG